MHNEGGVEGSSGLDLAEIEKAVLDHKPHIYTCILGLYNLAHRYTPLFKPRLRLYL